MQVTHFYRVHYQDLEAYLARVYRMQGYDFRLATGATPGMCPEYIVLGELPPAANARQQADNIRRGRRTRNLGLILNVLCIDGFIPEGKYVIDNHDRVPPITVYTQLVRRIGDPADRRCVEFRQKNKTDKHFLERAATVDRLVVRLQEKSN
jgi:hypothetical protein